MEGKWRVSKRNPSSGMPMRFRRRTPATHLLWAREAPFQKLSLFRFLLSQPFQQLGESALGPREAPNDLNSWGFETVEKQVSVSTTLGIDARRAPNRTEEANTQRPRKSVTGMGTPPKTPAVYPGRAPRTPEMDKRCPFWHNRLIPFGRLHGPKWCGTLLLLSSVSRCTSASARKLES